MGTLVAMCYQTIWMAFYDSKNIIHWPMNKFIKQICVDALTIAIMNLVVSAHPVNSLFVLSSVSYMSWVILAIKISIMSVVIICIVNTVTYREYMLKLFNCIIGISNKVFARE